MPEQRTLEELKRMSRDEVHRAFRAGELDTLMGRTPASNGSSIDPQPDEPGSITVDMLKRMRPEDIVKARKEGKLDHLLAHQPRVPGRNRKSSARMRRTSS